MGKPEFTGDVAVTTDVTVLPYVPTISAVKRAVLVAGVDTLFDLGFLCRHVDILVIGTDDAYIGFDAVATVDGVASTLVPAGMYYGVDLAATVVHVVSSGTPTIQITGVK